MSMPTAVSDEVKCRRGMDELLKTNNVSNNWISRSDNPRATSARTAASA
jgi:hypothetical protein